MTTVKIKSPLNKIKQYLSQRKRAYDMAFGAEAGKAVLDDLAVFCRATESCFHTDARVHAVLEGRREVWLRIQQHLTMSEDQLVQLHVQRTMKATND